MSLNNPLFSPAALGKFNVCHVQSFGLFLAGLKPKQWVSLLEIFASQAVSAITLARWVQSTNDSMPVRHRFDDVESTSHVSVDADADAYADAYACYNPVCGT